MTDRQVLYTTAFLRAIVTAMVAVQLGVYLPMLGLSVAVVGVIVGAGLAGAALAALLATLVADTHGRRRVLIEVAVLSAVGAVAASMAADPLLLGTAAFVGMLNGMGRDRGAALILEQAMLPATTTDLYRTRVLAWYNVLQDGGHALGALLAGVPYVLERSGTVSRLAGHRGALVAYAVVMLILAVLYATLTPAVEPDGAHKRRRASPRSRRLITRISALFALDSFGGGFLTTALLSYFFFTRFGVSELTIGALFFGARALNAFSHLGAAWLARRIGLLNTMVFTHIPSSLLLVTVAFAPNFPIAALLFLLREGLVEMDVPTRQSYVLAVVQPAERTLASGVTNLVRLASWATAPALAGLFMEDVALMTPLLIAAAMKVAYDILLYVAFRAVKPPEEVA